jgi:UDP-3-O-acyl-N-acetylglucosamine deacetylase
LSKQEGGSHYKDLVIQPIEYIHANSIPFAEGSVIKYVTRWRTKGGIKDLEKAKHFLELLIELETRNARKTD